MTRGKTAGSVGPSILDSTPSGAVVDRQHHVDLRAVARSAAHDAATLDLALRAAAARAARARGLEARGPLWGAGWPPAGGACGGRGANPRPPPSPARQWRPPPPR